MSELTPNERACLKDFLTGHFNIDELEDLVFDLSISHETFPHETLTQFARELIEAWS